MRICCCYRLTQVPHSKDWKSKIIEVKSIRISHPNEFRQDVMCVDIPDTQRATVEFPDGHWFAAVRAVYVDPNPANPTGVWKAKFSNVIEVRTRPLIATPIEGIGP